LKFAFSLFPPVDGRDERRLAKQELELCNPFGL
jgi:hypothetical protein